MKAARIITGSIATLLILGLLTLDHYFVGGFLSAALLSVVAFTAAMELCVILEAAGLKTYPRLTAFVSFVVALLPAVVLRFWRGLSPFAPQAGVIFGFMVLLFVLAMREEDLVKGAKAVISGTFVLVYVGLSLSFLVRLRDFPHTGEAFLLFAIGVAKVGDIGAYFTGKLFGRHYLAPKVSPKKTLEGSLGALAGSAGVALIMHPYVKDHVSLGTFVAWALILSVVAQFGDLAESLIKRAGEVKDSGGVFAAMGGVLDLVDSLLLSAPVAYILALIGGFGGIQG